MWPTEAKQLSSTDKVSENCDVMHASMAICSDTPEFDCHSESQHASIITHASISGNSINHKTELRACDMHGPQLGP